MPSLTIDTREGHLGIDVSNSTVCTGVNVDKVHPKDLCALAGLKASMVITSVNGVAVYEHEGAMELMKEAKAKETKLTLEYLTEAAAKEQGAVEWASQKKWLLRGLLIVLALVALAAAYVVSNGGLAKVLGIDPNATSAGAAGAEKPSLEAMMGSEADKMKAMMDQYMTPEMKVKIEEAKANAEAMKAKMAATGSAM